MKPLFELGVGLGILGLLMIAAAVIILWGTPEYPGKYDPAKYCIANLPANLILWGFGLAFVGGAMAFIGMALP